MSTGIRIDGIVPSPIPLLSSGDAPHSDRAVRRGELVVVTRGVYAEAAEWRALKPWERYLARVHAAALTYPDAVFVLESGAALRGMPVFLEPPAVHVARPTGSTAREYSGVRVHTAERMPLADEIGGLLVATPAEIAVDIARSRHRAIGLTVAGSAMRGDHTVTRDELIELNAARPSARGRRHARWALDRATPVPESPLEQVSLAVIEWLGFPALELQKWVLGKTGADDDRLDFWWEVARIAGEADGDVKYSGTMGDARDALNARNARDARLLARGVASTAHWGWRDAIAARQLRALLLAAGLRPERPEDTAQLRSLQRALTAPSASTAPSALTAPLARRQ